MWEIMFQQEGRQPQFEAQVVVHSCGTHSRGFQAELDLYGESCLSLLRMPASAHFLMSKNQSISDILSGPRCDTPGMRDDQTYSIHDAIFACDVVLELQS